MAINIGFVFPKFIKVDLEQVVKRCPPEGLDLLERMLSWDPNHRLTTTQCLNHPLFQEIRLKDKQITRSEHF